MTQTGLPSLRPKIVNKRYRYDLRFVQEELESMLSELYDDPSIITKTSLLKNRGYSSWQFAKWRAKFPDNNRTQELQKKIDEVCEDRLIQQGLTGKNFPFVIFLLKNHYGYADKREIETETTHVFKVSRGDIKVLKAKVVKPK